jgi:hypothetical protein
MPYARATWTAAIIAQFLAAAMAAMGVMAGSLNLLFVALFVFLAARREARETETEAHADRKSAAGPQAADAAESLIVLPAHVRADEVTRVLFARQSFFPVAQGGEVIGVVSKGRLLRAIANGRGDRLIAELMDHTRGEGLQVALATVGAKS